MPYKNNLLGRCSVALDAAISGSDYPAHTMRTRQRGVAAVFEHLAAELILAGQRDKAMTVHGAARLLLEAAKEAK